MIHPWSLDPGCGHTAVPADLCDIFSVTLFCPAVCYTGNDCTGFKLPPSVLIIGKHVETRAGRDSSTTRPPAPMPPTHRRQSPVRPPDTFHHRHQRRRFPDRKAFHSPTNRGSQPEKSPPCRVHQRSANRLIDAFQRFQRRVHVGALGVIDEPYASPLTTTQRMFRARKSLRTTNNIEGTRSTMRRWQPPWRFRRCDCR